MIYRSPSKAEKMKSENEIWLFTQGEYLIVPILYGKQWQKTSKFYNHPNLTINNK